MRTMNNPNVTKINGAESRYSTGRMMALRNARIITAAIPDATPLISMPGIIWLANKTANPVIPHRIKKPFMVASYRPCGRGLKPWTPMVGNTSLGHGGS